MNTKSDPAFEFVKRLGEALASSDFDLPPCPDSLLRIQKALRDPDISIDSLSRIVRSEPVLTARLLRMANSAMLRRGTIEIIDVKTAISRIGLNMVQTAAASLAVNDAFPVLGGSSLTRLFRQIRKHSINVSVLAFVLATKARTSVDPDEAMLAGLMHDIGKFYILSRAKDFPELFANAEDLNDLVNVWHTGVGHAIVDSWGFPAHISLAVDEHELVNREKTGQADIVDIIIVANLIANRHEKQTSEQPKLDGVPSLVRIGINGETLSTIIKASNEEIRSMTQALSS